jgi:hypothetical protein
MSVLAYRGGAGAPTSGELAHAGDGAFGENDVIEGVPLAEELAVTEQLGMHEAACVDDGGASHPRLERGVELGEGDLCQEAKGAEIDAEDWGIGAGEGTGSGEQGPIAAQGDDHHGVIAVHCGAFDGLIFEADVGGAVGLEDGGEASGAEPGDEFGEDELQLGLLRLGDDGYRRHR